jgi:hypothetical protein
VSRVARSARRPISRVLPDPRVIALRVNQEISANECLHAACPTLLAHCSCFCNAMVVRVRSAGGSSATAPRAVRAGARSALRDAERRGRGGDFYAAPAREAPSAMPSDADAEGTFMPSCFNGSRARLRLCIALSDDQSHIVVDACCKQIENYHFSSRFKDS